MSDLLNLRGFLLAIRNSICKASNRFGQVQDELLGQYFRPDQRNVTEPIQISIAHPVIDQFEVPLLALLPLNNLGVTAVTVGLTLQLKLANGTLMVSMVKDQTASSFSFEMIIDPTQSDADFEKVMDGMEIVLREQLP